MGIHSTQRGYKSQCLHCHDWCWLPVMLMKTKESTQHDTALIRLKGERHNKSTAGSHGPWFLHVADSLSHKGPGSIASGRPEMTCHCLSHCERLQR